MLAHAVDKFSMASKYLKFLGPSVSELTRKDFTTTNLVVDISYERRALARATVASYHISFLSMIFSNRSQNHIDNHVVSRCVTRPSRGDLP